METTGPFHLTKNSRTFPAGANGRTVSWESFRQIRELLNFRNANHLTENSGNFGRKIKWDGNSRYQFLQNFGIPSEVALSENAGPFAAGNVPEFSLLEWKAPSVFHFAMYVRSVLIYNNLSFLLLKLHSTRLK